MNIFHSQVLEIPFYTQLNIFHSQVLEIPLYSQLNRFSSEALKVFHMFLSYLYLSSNNSSERSSFAWEIATGLASSSS